MSQVKAQRGESSPSARSPRPAPPSCPACGAAANTLIEALDFAANALRSAIRTNKAGWYEEEALKRVLAALQEHSTWQRG